MGNRTQINSYQSLNMRPPLPDITYTHDNDNRMLTAGTSNFNYDNNGNLIQETGGSPADYTWNYNDMLTQLVKGGNTYNYVYDALGNRVSKTVNGTQTRYLPSMLGETDSGGDITAYYVYGIGLISKITPTNQAYFYHFDGLGNTVAMTDSTGNVVNKYTYDEYGNVIGIEETIPNPFRYVGQYGVMDEGNGLFYMRARYYDADLGRFISKDPIGFEGGLNFYEYVKNNPLNWVDLQGQRKARPPRYVPKPPKNILPIDPINPEKRAPGAGSPPPCESCEWVLKEYCDEGPWFVAPGTPCPPCTRSHWEWILVCPNKTYRPYAPTK